VTLRTWHSELSARLLATLVALTALGWAKAAGQAGTPPVDATFAEIRALIDARKTQEALERLKGLDQNEPRVRHLIGVALYHTDRHEGAVQVLSDLQASLAESAPERPEVEQILGLSLHLLGKHAEAIPWLERTRTRMPSSTELSFTLGQAYIQTRQPDKAREALAAAFDLRPDSAAAHVVAAQLMIRLQHESLAEAELNAAIKKDSRTLRANYLLGQLALFRGQLQDALAFSARELAINPSDAMAFYQMGDAYVRLSQWDQAIHALQRSLWLNPYYSGPYILLGRAYMRTQQPATAERMLRRAIEYDPNNRAAHYLLAQLFQQTGRLDEARTEFAIAEKLQGQPRE
jgi:cytochrome c-type biogenesis protein CcmH/NrfG